MNYVLKQVGKIVQSAFRIVRLDLFPYKLKHHYVPDIYGHAAFKQVPINELPGFGTLATKVIQERRSTLYYDRLHVIYQALVNLKARFDSAGPLNSVEVGVYKGGTSYFIASASKHLGLQVTHHCFDTFEGHAEQDIDSLEDTAHRPGIFGDTQYESVRDYLKKFDSVHVFKGRFQDTCHELEKKKIHFVHFDVDIYLPTSFGLQFLHPRMAKGGMIVVDDYGFTTCPGVKKAVDEFVAATSGYFSLSLLTGQYLLVKLDE